MCPRRLLVIFAIVVAASPARAEFIVSDFATGADGWTNVQLPYPSAIPPTILGTYPPSWTLGRISLQDPDGSGQSGNAQYWIAPDKFLGNRSAAYGDSLLYDIDDVGTGFGSFTQEDVILTSPTLTLTLQLAALPGATRTTVRVPLVESAWHRDNLAGPAPSQAEFKGVLSALTNLLIRAEYQLGPDTQHLYRVALAPHTTVATSSPVAPAALALAVPSPNPSGGAVRIAFALPCPGSVDVAVFDAGGRRVATLAHGVLDAGTHALARSGRDDAARALGAGLYWVRARAGDEVVTRRIVRLR